MQTTHLILPEITFFGVLNKIVSTKFGWGPARRCEQTWLSGGRVLVGCGIAYWRGEEEKEKEEDAVPLLIKSNDPTT